MAIYGVCGRMHSRCKALAKDVPNALHFVLPIQSQVEMEYVSAMFTLKQPGESSDANDSAEVTLEQIIKQTRECAEAGTCLHIWSAHTMSVPHAVSCVTGALATSSHDRSVFFAYIY